jgi:hypothetical protein
MIADDVTGNHGVRKPVATLAANRSAVLTRKPVGCGSPLPGNACRQEVVDDNKLLLREGLR